MSESLPQAIPPDCARSDRIQTAGLTGTGTALVLDAGSRGIRIALRDRSGCWHPRDGSDDEGVEAVFPLLAGLFRETAIRPPHDVDQVVYCGGPGSLLGLRTVAMLLGTWGAIRKTPLPLLRYHALDLAHACLRLQRGPALPPSFHILSEWRRDQWQTLAVVDGQPGQPAVAATSTVASWKTPCFLLEQRKRWGDPPCPSEPIDYNLTPFTLPDAFTPDCLESVREPTLITTGSTDYQKWNARRHQSP